MIHSYTLFNNDDSFTARRKPMLNSAKLTRRKGQAGRQAGRHRRPVLRSGCSIAARTKHFIRQFVAWQFVAHRCWLHGVAERRPPLGVIIPWYRVHQSVREEGCDVVVRRIHMRNVPVHANTQQTAKSKPTSNLTIAYREQLVTVLFYNNVDGIITAWRLRS